MLWRLRFYNQNEYGVDSLNGDVYTFSYLVCSFCDTRFESWNKVGRLKAHLHYIEEHTEWKKLRGSKKK
jgi:hypothetical protein